MFMKAKKGNIFIRLGLLLIGAAFLLTAYNIGSNIRAGKLSQEALSVLIGEIESGRKNSLDNKTANDKPLYERYPEMDMPLININGKDYIGILKIDSLGMELPIKSEFSYPNLRETPCRYDGSVYTNNMIIAGHNYARHFGNLKNIAIGDEAIFIDGDGNEFKYCVSDVLQVEGTDMEGMKSGQWDLTLFTCTLNGRNRIAVRLEKVKF